MPIILLAAVLIGLSLGLLGSGGSILTVPVLVYLVGQPEKIAIAGSLAIVGGIALVGALPYTLQRRVDWRSVLWFGVPGMVGAWFGAWLSQWVSGAVQLLLFAAVMVVAALMMLRNGRSPETRDPSVAPRSRLAISLDGLVVGAVTGLVGVGGGFLIVPALVLLGGLSMHRALGTSLWIIAGKSFAGLQKYVSVLAATGLVLDWRLLGVLTAVGAGGSLLGNRLASRIPQHRLKQIFAIGLLLMAGFITWRTAPTVL